MRFVIRERTIVFTPKNKNNNMNGDDIFTKGIMFKKVASDRPKEEKVKTKAKKKAYITGQHHSASAKMKAEIRRKRANRHKGQ